MNRENRYIVIKRKDAEKHLSQGELDTLHILADQVADGREYDQKPPLNCVVVESDWPEYEPTWAAIAARVDGAPQPVPADEADGEEKLLREIIECGQAIRRNIDEDMGGVPDGDIWLTTVKAHAYVIIEDAEALRAARAQGGSKS